MFVVPLNLPPGVLFQRHNIFLSLIILEHPGNNMSVYIEPLIDDLVRAWEEGVWTYDRATKTNFKMCMFGTSTPCMTIRRMGYSAAGVFTGSSHAQYARRL